MKTIFGLLFSIALAMLFSTVAVQLRLVRGGSEAYSATNGHVFPYDYRGKRIYLARREHLIAISWFPVSLGLMLVSAIGFERAR